MRLLLVSVLAMFISLAADRSDMKPPDEVAAVVPQALSDSKPKRRYMIVPEQAQAAAAIQGVVDVLMQLNEDQAYTYDRTELNRMMDKAAARTRETQR